MSRYQNSIQVQTGFASLRNDPNYTQGFGSIYSVVRNATLGPLGVWLFGEMQPDETVNTGQLDKVTVAAASGVTSGLSTGITIAIVGAAVYFLFLRK